MTDYKNDFEIVPKCPWKRRRESIIEWGLILVIYSAVACFIVFACNPYLFCK